MQFHVFIKLTFSKQIKYFSQCNQYQLRQPEIAFTVWKVPEYGVFPVLIFWHSDWIRKDTECISELSLNTRKWGPEKTSYLNTFHAVIKQSKKISKLRLIKIDVNALPMLFSSSRFKHDCTRNAMWCSIYFSSNL